jgi:L-galactose dehydrogenase/L-glyceraldehyde 3-phosphate reductase
MNLRRLGRTDLKISEIAFGGGQSGGILINSDDDTKRRAVRTALGHGVNWFDTAPQYGNGKSEEALGWLLEEIEETPYVSTKVRIDVSGLDDITGQVERSLHESLRRLKRESVDLLQLHNRIMPAMTDRDITADHVLGPNGVADGLERMRDQGLIRFIGLTGLGDRHETRRVIESGRFDSAQVYYNMLNPSAARDAMPNAWRGFNDTGIMAACKAQDMGILAIRIFAASYLATPVRTGRESILTTDTAPDSEAQMANCLFAGLGDRYGSRAQTAVRFALTNQDVSAAIIGMSDPAHMDEAAEGWAKGPLPAQALDQLEALYGCGFNLP